MTVNKIALASVMMIFLSGCASVQKASSYIPSFWDDNQSAAIIDVRQSIELLDCAKEHLPQVELIKNKIQWFDLYSESKGSRQQDVRKLVDPLYQTVNDFYSRSKDKPGSAFYCETKKTIMQTQSAKAAEAVMRRF